MKNNGCEIMKKRCDLGMTKQMVRVFPFLWSSFIIISLANGKVLKPCQTNDDCSPQRCVKNSLSEFGVCENLVRKLTDSVETLTNKIDKISLNSFGKLENVNVTDKTASNFFFNSGKSQNVSTRKEFASDFLKQLVGKGRLILLNNDLDLGMKISAENNFSSLLVSAKLFVNPKKNSRKSVDSLSPNFGSQNEVKSNNISQLNNNFVDKSEHNINKSNEISSNKFLYNFLRKRGKPLKPIHYSSFGQKQNISLNQSDIKQINQTLLFQPIQSFFNSEINHLVGKVITEMKSNKKLQNVSSFKKSEKEKTKFNYTADDSKNTSRNFAKKIADNIVDKEKVKNQNEKNKNKIKEEGETKSGKKLGESKKSIDNNFLDVSMSFLTKKAVSEDYSFPEIVMAIRKYFESFYKGQILKKLFKSNQNFSKLIENLKVANSQQNFINNNELNVGKNFPVSNHSFFLPFIMSMAFTSNKTILPISEKIDYSIDSKKSFPVGEESKQFFLIKNKQLNSSVVTKNRSKRSLEFNENQVANYKVNNIKERQKRSLDGFQNSLLSESELGGSAAKIPRQIFEEAIVPAGGIVPGEAIVAEEPVVVEPSAVVVDEVSVDKANPMIIQEEIVKPISQILPGPRIIQDNSLVQEEPIIIGPAPPVVVPEETPMVIEPIIEAKIVAHPEVIEEVVSQPEVVNKVVQPQVAEEVVAQPEVVKEVVSPPQVVEEVMSQPEIVEEVIPQPQVVEQVAPRPAVVEEMVVKRGDSKGLPKKDVTKTALREKVKDARKAGSNLIRKTRQVANTVYGSADISAFITGTSYNDVHKKSVRSTIDNNKLSDTKSIEKRGVKKTREVIEEFIGPEVVVDEPVVVEDVPGPVVEEVIVKKRSKDKNSRHLIEEIIEPQEVPGPIVINQPVVNEEIPPDEKRNSGRNYKRKSSKKSKNKETYTIEEKIMKGGGQQATTPETIEIEVIEERSMKNIKKRNRRRKYKRKAGKRSKKSKDKKKDTMIVEEEIIVEQDTTTTTESGSGQTNGQESEIEPVLIEVIDEGHKKKNVKRKNEEKPKRKTGKRAKKSKEEKTMIEVEVPVPDDRKSTTTSKPKPEPVLIELIEEPYKKKSVKKRYDEEKYKTGMKSKKSSDEETIVVEIDDGQETTTSGSNSETIVIDITNGGGQSTTTSKSDTELTIEVIEEPNKKKSVRKRNDRKKYKRKTGKKFKRSKNKKKETIVEEIIVEDDQETTTSATSGSNSETIVIEEIITTGQGTTTGGPGEELLIEVIEEPKKKKSVRKRNDREKHKRETGKKSKKAVQEEVIVEEEPVEEEVILEEIIEKPEPAIVTNYNPISIEPDIPVIKENPIVEVLEEQPDDEEVVEEVYVTKRKSGRKSKRKAGRKSRKSDGKKETLEIIIGKPTTSTTESDDSGTTETDQSTEDEIVVELYNENPLVEIIEPRHKKRKLHHS